MFVAASTIVSVVEDLSAVPAIVSLRLSVGGIFIIISYNIKLLYLERLRRSVVPRSKAPPQNGIGGRVTLINNPASAPPYQQPTPLSAYLD